MEGYYPPTIRDGLELPPEAVWMFSVTSLLILALFIAAAVMLNRKHGGKSQRGMSVPPIPQRAEYDSSLSPDERSFELEWIEGLMAAPAYGERTPGDEKRAEETDR